MHGLLVSRQHDAEPAVGLSNDVMSHLIPNLPLNSLYHVQKIFNVFYYQEVDLFYKYFK